MGELSLNLSQTRQARGLTLDDAERSTRIAKKFLIALEDHNYSIFPAPVYARGFLRSYCRYLGIDPEPQLAELPQGWAAAPPVQTEPVRATRASRPGAERQLRQPMEINYGWLVIGVALAAVLIGGFLYTRGEEGLTDLGPQSPTQGQQQDLNSDHMTPSEVLASTPAGTMASFTGVSIDDSLAFLKDRDLSYLVIEAADPNVPAGTVINQSPASGARTADGMIVTLTVSAGPTAGNTIRTDCAVLASAQVRTTAEQAWFQSNCNGSTPNAPSVQPTTLPNRTTCAEISGTQYRSDVEMNFFRNNCASN